MKSLTAMIAAGLNPFEIIGSHHTPLGKPALKAIIDHAGPLGAETYPGRLLEPLAVLYPDAASSNHARMTYTDIFTEGAAGRILALDPTSHIAGLDRSKWKNINGDVS